MNSSFQNLLAERYLRRTSLRTSCLPENARRPFLEPKIEKNIPSENLRDCFPCISLVANLLVDVLVRNQ